MMDEGRKFTARRVERVAVPARGKKRYRDHTLPGLELVVRASGNRTWYVRYTTRTGRKRELKLGDARTLSVDRARKLTLGYLARVHEGGDPKAEQDAERRNTKRPTAALGRASTCASVARAFIQSMRAGWSPAEAPKWESDLKRFVDPFIGHLHPRAIGVPEVRAVLEPLWFTSPKTGERIRAKLQRILDYAEACELRSGPNPARWAKLKALLPDPRKLAQQEHRAALPFAEVPLLMKELGQTEGVAARALEITILCALRSGEVRHARWSEVDLRTRVWTIPAARMKARREHRVPLTDQAIAILSAVPREGEYVFIGAHAGKPIGRSGMIRVLAGLRPGVTVHGMRSSFRDWAGETTSFPREVAEMALAHALEGGVVEAAYARSDLLERRRELMAAWASYCVPAADGDKVIALRA